MLVIVLEKGLRCITSLPSTNCISVHAISGMKCPVFCGVSAGRISPSTVGHVDQQGACLCFMGTWQAFHSYVARLLKLPRWMSFVPDSSQVGTAYIFTDHYYYSSPGSAIGLVCLCVRRIPSERDEPWPSYLTFWLLRRRERCELLRSQSLCVCLFGSVCLSVCPLAYLKSDIPNFIKFSLRVTRGRGSVLQCSTLCTSGFCGWRHVFT